MGTGQNSGSRRRACPPSRSRHESKRCMFNIETSAVDHIANSLSDAEILATSALLFGLVGGLVAFLANRFWFCSWPMHGPYDDKFGEAAHTSMIGFSLFVLALLITNELATLSETDKSVRLEATTVCRLGKELDSLGPSALAAKQALASYAQNIAQDELASSGETAGFPVAPCTKKSRRSLGCRSLYPGKSGRNRSVAIRLSC
jgi:hypothetical protein